MAMMIRPELMAAAVLMATVFADVGAAKAAAGPEAGQAGLPPGAAVTSAPGRRAADLPPNQWVPMNEPPMGVQLLGWDEIRYAPQLEGVLFYGAFRSFTSENQNAIWLYRFNENRWRLLHINLFFNRDELACDGGHTSGRMVFDEARKVLVHQGLVSMSRNDRFRTWVFDPLAVVGWDANPPPPSANIEYDGASAWAGDLKASFQYRADRGAWAYDAVTNRWKQLAPPGNGPPAAAEAVYDAKRKRVLAFGGARGHYGGKPYQTFNDLWAFDIAANTWQKLETKNPPPGRGWPQMAISTAADVLLLAGGFTGEMTAQGVSKWHQDTWVLKLDSLEWESLALPEPAPQSGYSNHLEYDPANDVFLYLTSRPTKNLGYGYQCAMYALRYEAKGPTRGRPPAVTPTPGYDMTALPGGEGGWVPLGGPGTAGVTAVKGWAFRPSLASTGNELLLAFGEYDPPGKYGDEGCYVYAFRWAGGQWTRLGARAVSDAGAPPAHSQCPSATFDSAGRPVVAYQSIRPWKPVEIIVKRFENEWKQIGSPAPPKQSLLALPALAGGRPPAGPLAAAWQHHPDYGKGIGVYAAEHSGDSWQPIAGGAALNVNDVASSRGQHVSLVRDGQGRLLAAWQEQKAGFNGENATPERIHVRRLEDGKWVELARELPVSSPQARALGYALTVHEGEPAAAVCEGADGGRASLVVYLWKGGQWTRLGDGPLNLLGPEGGALWPSMASDGKALFVAWPEFLPSRPPLLFVKKWDGSAWKLLGGPLNEKPGAGAVHHPAMAILAGKPVVAWTEHAVAADTLRQLFVKTLK